ncbi:MAG: PilZ domain-containing protein [Acidobacteriia bacterium]|nr:PilZ domain-containing protein [Terriglobia bacterium]
MPEYRDEDGGTRSNDRKETRWNIPIPVQIKGTLRDGREFTEDAVTADASPSGMCVFLTVEPKSGTEVQVTAPEESFESPARITSVSTLGTGMNRVRLRFPENRKFGRTTAARKYVYDFHADTWIGYLFEGAYYNSKHEPFGKLEGSRILSLDSGQILFTLRWDSLYDVRGNCVGHLI